MVFDKKNLLFLTLIILMHPILKSQTQNWTPLGSGTNTYVRALCVFNQKLFVGGDFIAAGGSSHNRVATWDNINWSKADSGVTWVSTRNFCIYNNELYAARDFGISKWDGAKWVPVNGLSTQVYELTVFQNELYAVGGWHIQKWNGSVWTDIGAPNTTVMSACVYNGELVVAGAFTDINGIAYNHIAKWDGSSWSALGIGILGGLAYKAKTYNGELYVGGSFLLNQGNPADFLVKWNGVTWSSAIPNNVGNIVTVLDSINGKLYIGGDCGFSVVSSNKIAAWNGVSLFGFGTGMNARVNAITEFNGCLYAGGEFTMAGGSLNLYISRWSCNVGLTDYELEDNGIKIYPNPFFEKTTIETDKKFNNAIITIYDGRGDIIRIINNITGKKIVLPLSNLIKGIYYIRIMENNEVITSRKLIIED